MPPSGIQPPPNFIFVIFQTCIHTYHNVALISANSTEKSWVGKCVVFLLPSQKSILADRMNVHQMVSVYSPRLILWCLSNYHRYPLLTVRMIHRNRPGNGKLACCLLGALRQFPNLYVKSWSIDFSDCFSKSSYTGGSIIVKAAGIFVLHPQRILSHS